MKIYELKISDELFDENSVTEIALVEQPAIETEWITLSKEKFVSYDDYPQYMSDAAQSALNYIEETGNPNDCLTQVGKTRGQQLAQRKPVSLDTLKRMKNYITRHMKDLDVSTSFDDGCGKLSMAMWGCSTKNECKAAEKWLERRITREEEFITPNPCQEGYEAIGTKIKDGREVPRCVPIRASKFDAVVDIDGVPLYKTSAEADSEAASMGCSGSHPHEYEGETLYMPCATHAEASQLWDDNSTERLSIDEKGIELQDLLDEGYVITDIKELNEDYQKELIEEYREKVNNRYSAQEFYRIVSSPNEPSIMDSSYRKRRYIYVIGPGQGSPLINTSRDFCQRMIGQKQLVFRFEDIQMLNLQLTAEDKNRKIIPRPKGTSPDIFIYKGGANCRHIFVELSFAADERIPKTATRGKRKAEMETPAPGEAGQVNPKVVYAASKEEDKPVTYEYGLPVYKMEEVAVWKSELMGCKGEYDETYYEGEKHFRPCKYVGEKSNFKNQFSFKHDEEKKMIYSPAMIPDRMIPRIDEITGEKYFVYFTKDTIEKIAQRFLMEKRTNNTNLEHTNLKYDDIYMVESWIVSTENDKAYSLGFTEQDVPIGSWMVAYKFMNDKVWKEYVKEGKVKGLSVEGEFELVQQSFNKEEYLYNEIINILKNTY